MKALKVLLQDERSKIEETKIKVRSVNLLRSIVILFMLLFTVFLTSCVFQGPGHSSRGGMNDRRSHHERSNQSMRHGQNQRLH